MFSNSNSYLGGGNTGRPGAPQYGQQQSQYGVPFGQQQQPEFSAQQTGIGGNMMQTQPTGYMGQPPQQQFLNPGGYGQQSFQGQAPQILQQPLQTGQQPAQRPIPQRTGQTSTEIAQSFQTASSSQSQPRRSSKTSSKIPTIRLSFITAQDQAKFEQLFKSAVGDSQALSGDKARDLLLRSKLSGDVLSQIWTLSDTTKSGQLLFPEFALAMYLCNLKLVGKELPSTLPERIANEVSSMVDIISFGVPDDTPQPPPRSNAPSFDVPLRQNALSPPAPQQPQPQQPSNSLLLAQLSAQPTGFQPQPTGFQTQGAFPSQPTGFQPQVQGVQMQQIGQHAQFNPSLGGPSGSRPPMPPMPTGFGSNLSPNVTGLLPLNAQPTGRPGQWGLVNTPSTGLPNIEALQQRMMPQPGREGGYTTAGLAGNATIPWAVTKDEKKIYDQLFRAWDGFNKGYIGGDVAIEIFGQSGLAKSDLEKIWTLADHGNKGRLNLDEFAVAMHLIYRKLNNYEIPNRLPPDLVPPSTRNFTDSIGTVKSLLSQDVESRKNSGAGLLPQKTGVSYLKSHSFRTASDSLLSNRKDATVFKNNDDDFGYKSSARRRLGAGRESSRSPSPAQPSSPLSDRSHDELSIDQLKKKIREKQILLDAIDIGDENQTAEYDDLDRRDRRDAEDLMRRIRRVQEDIDRHPNATFSSVDSGAERRAFRRRLQDLRDRLPELASQVRRTERNIADAKLELFRLRDAKLHPASASAIVGTGPGGAVTEADRLKARAKAMMQQRAAALTGRASTASDEDASAAPQRLEAESARIRSERESNERMIKDVEDSVEAYGKSLDDNLREDNEESSAEHEKRRWEDGLGVEDEVKDFIFDLQRSSRTTRLRPEVNDRPASDIRVQASSPPSRDSRRPDAKSRDTSVDGARSQIRPSPVSSSTGSTYSSYKTAEERAAFIKQQAEQRMAERLAALGIRPAAKAEESAQQRHDREAKEREDRLRQAEAEDAKREQERQRRLADEQPQAPPAVKSAAKKPPPPPSRKSARNDSVEKEQAKKKAEEEAAKAEMERKEQELRVQQEAQEAERKAIEDEAKRQEEELAREREAAQARLKALEEQVKQGKMKKEEEKRRKQAAQQVAKEKEAKLAAQRAELEAAKERERQLQLQLEQLGAEDSSSDDDEGPQQITPQEITPTMSQELPKDVSSPRQTTPVAASAPTVPPPAQPTPSSATSSQSSVPQISTLPDTESKNPFLKQLAQSGEKSTPLAPSYMAPVGSGEVSTNPFHRFAQDNRKSEPTQSPVTSEHTPTTRPSRVRPEEDEWSVVSDNASSDDEDEDQPRAGRNATQLASILFGTMAPPPPLPPNPTETQTSPKSNATEQSRAQTVPLPPTPAPAPPLPSTDEPPFMAPPPPPPPPSVPFDVPSAPPPPPPPPMPALTSSGDPSGPSSAPPFGKGALLGQIQTGRQLRKVETKDRSQAAVAGRVL